MSFVRQTERKRYHATVSGRVQGVFFRANTLERALSLGLSGWVKNLPDGRVETVFEGEKAAAEKLLSWLLIGSPPAIVEQCDFTEETPDGGLTDFRIIQD